MYFLHKGTRNKYYIFFISQKAEIINILILFLFHYTTKLYISIGKVFKVMREATSTGSFVRVVVHIRENVSSCLLKQNICVVEFIFLLIQILIIKDVIYYRMSVLLPSIQFWSFPPSWCPSHLLNGAHLKRKKTTFGHEPYYKCDLKSYRRTGWFGEVGYRGATYMKSFPVKYEQGGWFAD